MKHWLLSFLVIVPLSIALGTTMDEAEGIYDIQMVCEDRTNPNCQELNRKAKLSIIQTEDSVVANIGYPEQSLSRYSFVSQDLQLKDGHYYGTPSLKNSPASAPFSEILIDFKLENEKLVVGGVIRDARFLHDIKLSGTQLLPSKRLGPPEYTVNSTHTPPFEEGRFLAKGTYRQWLVTIRHALGGSTGTDFLIEATDMGHPETHEFASGDRMYLRSMVSSRTNGVEFIAPLSQPGSFLKWILWATPEDILRTEELHGFFFSSNGIFSPLTFERLK